LQQRSFDHLDSTEIKNVTGILIVLKHLNLYFHSMQPNLSLEGARDLNQSASFDNIVETKEQLSTTKNFQPGLIENKIGKDQTNCLVN
jgi:hypothetical protein